MSRESFYFSHDYNARNDQKILMLRGEHGLSGYALFWMLVETMAESDGYINRGAITGLSCHYGTTKELLTDVIDYCVQISLFIEDKELGIYSQRMMDHKSFRQHLSENGTKGANKKWQSYREAMATPMQRKEKKRKEQEKKTIPISKWKTDFETYKNELREAYKLAIGDLTYLKERASYHPKLDIVKSLEKACKDYWATEAGWKKKKSAKTETIDWVATFNNALSLKTNQVWLQDGQPNVISEADRDRREEEKLNKLKEEIGYKN